MRIAGSSSKLPDPQWVKAPRPEWDRIQFSRGAGCGPVAAAPSSVTWPGRPRRRGRRRLLRWSSAPLLPSLRRWLLKPLLVSFPLLETSRAWSRLHTPALQLPRWLTFSPLLLGRPSRGKLCSPGPWAFHVGSCAPPLPSADTFESVSRSQLRVVPPRLPSCGRVRLPTAGKPTHPLEAAVATAAGASFGRLLSGLMF